jgi:hypothetical protein
MTDRPPGRLEGWLAAVRRGAVVAVVVLAVGEGLALAVWAWGGTGISLGAALRVGLLYVGAFHHAEVRVRILDVVTPAASEIALTLGVALTTVTLGAGWLLARAGRDLGRSAGGGAPGRVVAGARVALGYAVPFAVLAPLAVVETARPNGGASVIRASLVWWQAAAFPLVLGAAAGAAGGAWSSVVAGGSPTLRGAVAGLGRMVVLALALAFAALFVGGIVQPDGPLALATPTTARYLRPVVERPAFGLVALGHHVAVAPSEAVWTLAPAMGACDRVAGSIDVAFLCYGRFPQRVGTTLAPISSTEVVTLPFGEATFGSAPAGYLLFLLVPALATVLGGARAARGLERREALAAAALAGAGFGLAVGALALVATVTVGFRSSIVGEISSGRYVIGPALLPTTGLALAWGVGGGLVGSLLGRAAASRARERRGPGSEPGPREVRGARTGDATR